MPNSRKANLAYGTDIAVGDGYGSQSDIFAIALMPYYDFTDNWQAVMSYNYVTSDGSNGVRLDRYENRSVSGRAGRSFMNFLLVSTTTFMATS